MNYAYALFPAAWHGLALLLSLAVLAWCVRTAPWARFKTQTQVNVWAGFAVGMALMWSMRAGVQPGLSLHFLGGMAATLLFGPQLAICTLALALAAVVINGAVEWQAIPINFVLMVVLPVAVAQGLHRILSRRLPAHFFVFIFVEAFMGAAVTVLVQGAVSSGLLVAAGAYAADAVLSDYLPFFLLLGFAEAWLTGMTVTLMVVYRPEWVSTFDDMRYLRDK